jgi:hypothetical protein
LKKREPLQAIHKVILNLRWHYTQETIVANQLKTRERWNVIIARKWVTHVGTVDFEPMMFSRESSKINHM